MKRTQICFLVIIWAMMLAVPATTFSQSILNKAKQKIKQRADTKVDKAMNDGLDKAENKKAKTEEDARNEDAAIKSEDRAKEGSKPMAFSSKYDFVPGEKVMAYEDFSTTEIGDFPVRWNTNITAEVVTLNTKEGKWLKIAKEGAFHPEFISNLPDNFTLEFDLGVNEGWTGNYMAVNLANLKNPQSYTDYGHYVSWKGDYAVHLEFKAAQRGRTSASSRITAGKDGNHVINNDVDFKTWDNASNNFAHISMWRQAQRLRVYVNGEKIWDIPRAFDAASTFNAVTFGMQGSNNPEDYMLLGNIRLAVGAADTRNKLVTEGKFITRGILFDVNSDKIKPESSGALKDIANVLKENPTLKVKIVGHTDADGEEAANLELSKRRASAVKSALVQEYGIASETLETDGKGESQLVDKSSTIEGKANNRRVEFIKM